jgi:DNA-binding NarL/FixJ family response regulator
MLAKGMPIEEISKKLDLTNQEVEEIKKNINKEA